MQMQHGRPLARQMLSVSGAVLTAALLSGAAGAEITVTEHPEGLVRLDEQVTVSWEEGVNCRLEYGRAPGTYTGETTAQGWGSLVFTPASEGMTHGIYYCVVSETAVRGEDGDRNDERRNTEGDAPTGRGEKSDEFVLIVDSPFFPRPAAPPNGSTVNQTTTTLAWDPVDGVPYYHVVVSDHDVDIEFEGDELVVRGANIVWQAITGATSIQYGSPDPSGYFTSSNGTSPPLMSGLDYHWLVFNNFGNNPLLSSTSGAGLAAFDADVAVAVEAPSLESPPDSVLLTAEQVEFTWDPVEGASGYHVYLYETREWGQAEASFPVWDSPSPTNSMEAHLGGFLVSGHYLWRVVALDASGGGAPSEMRSFDYATETGTARIRTRREDGEPLPNAIVEIEFLDGGVNLLPAVTDGAGAADVELVPGEYAFEAAKPDYRDTTACASVTAGDGTLVLIELRKASASMRGMVTDDDGEPVFDASVVATCGVEVEEASSDHSGYFAMRVPAGEWTVRAEKPGFAPSEPITIALHADDYADIGTLTLAGTPGSASGNVVNDAGAAVAGAGVTAESSFGRAETTTDASGRFSFALAPGEWSISAEKSGFIESDPRAILIESASQTEVAPPLVLSPVSCAVMGRITDGRVSVAEALVTAVPPTGAPRAVTADGRGEFVVLLPPGRFDLIAERDGYAPSEPVQVDVASGQSYTGTVLVLGAAGCVLGGAVMDGSGPVPGAEVLSGPHRTEASPDGSFALAVSPGLHELTATAEGRVHTEPVVVSVPPGDEVSGLEIRMIGDAATAAGRVLCGGQPVPLATVSASSSSGTFETAADLSGEFTLMLEPGQWSVSAKKYGFVPDHVPELTLAAGQTSDAVLPTLEEAAGELKGTVTGGSGPLRGARVVALATDGSGRRFRTSTDTEGRYSLRVPADTAFAVDFSASWHASGSASAGPLAAGGTEIVDAALEAVESCVRGTVRGLDGVPLAGATASVPGRGASAVAGPRGDYTLWVDPGAHDVQFNHPGYEDVVVPGVAAPYQDAVVVDTELPGVHATVSGTVTDTLSGGPVQGALVSVNSDYGASAVTGADGRYVLNGLAPGSARLSISRHGYAARSLPLALTEHEDRTLDVGLVRLTGTIDGTVTDLLAGSPIEGAVVRARLGGDVASAAVTGADGAYTLEGLDPVVAYDVHASGSGYAVHSENPVTGVLAASSGVDFVLELCDGRISGAVTDAAGGDPLEGARVRADDGFGHSGSGLTDEDGSFELESLLGSAVYEVTVSLYGYEDTVVDSVPAGSGPLDIALDRNFGNVSGTVVAPGGDVSISDVTIVATNIAYAGGSRTAVPDVGGQYEMAELRPGNYLLTVSGQGIFSSPSQLNLAVGEGDTVIGLDFTVERASVDRVEVAGPGQIETGTSAPFSGSVFADDGRLVDTELEWRLSPACAGEIGRGTGWLSVSEGYFGEVTVTAGDLLSGATGSASANVYVRLTPTGAISATDSLGITLAAGPGAVTETKSIFVDHESLPDAMRYSAGHVVGPEAIHFKPCGMPFVAAHRPTLTVPSSSGDQELVRWSHEYLDWELMESQLTGAGLEHELSDLGMYAVRTRSGPLGVSDVRSIPNPFSPGDGPVTIVFELSSDSARMPFVTVRIFNMAARPVRELMADQPQPKGTVSVEWDGLTDAGERARNGRYVVEVRARDTGGDETALGTLVLVK